MRRAGFRLIVVLLLAIALIQSMGSVVAVNDTTPPVFQSLSVSPTSVAAGSNFTVTARITDDLAGVSTGCCQNSVAYRFNGPSGQYLNGFWTRVSGTAQDGIYQAVITVPAAYPSGTYYVSSLNVSDTASNSTSVSYPAPPTTDGTIVVGNAAPTLTGLNPASLPAGGGAFSLMVFGSNFQNGATVSWNNSPRTTTFVSPTQLTAQITAADIASPGSISVRVINPDSQGSPYAAFTITIPPPSPQSVSPASGPASGGTSVTITGKYFQSGATVSFGGAPATSVVVVNPTQITAITPAYTGAVVGNVTITVRNPDGQTGSGGGFDYIERPGPVISGAQPVSQPGTRGGPTDPGQQPVVIPPHR
jgi:hypothetical protein